MSGNDDLEVYIFDEGNPNRLTQSNQTAVKLIVSDGVQVVPSGLCYKNKYLREVILPYGLIRIEFYALALCENLLEIKIPSTVQHIEHRAFQSCKRLTKVDFEFSTSSPHHQLRKIGDKAFLECRSLPRIKVPSSVNTLGRLVFAHCYSLTEANFSTTRITEISYGAFALCDMLQTVSLPNTLEQICDNAFSGCTELVTVVVPEDSPSIRIGPRSFETCRRLANFVIPRGSTAEEDSFVECPLLHERYGEESSCIVTGLIGRFDDLPDHRACYNHSSITVQELQQCIADQQEEASLVDHFGMTPFHVFFSSAEPSIDLLDVLLDSLPNQTLLKLKDGNDRRPLDYLRNNWTDGTGSLLQRTLQKWVIDRLAGWGATSWMEAMQRKVQEILTEDGESRWAFLNEAYSSLERYENIESSSMLEMALWKAKLKSGRSNDGNKRQALDREECRCLSGSDVVIPLVTMFLDISQASS